RAALPRDEWIIGDASSGREYVYHARPPRFLARVVMCNDQGLPDLNEAPADIVSGVVHAGVDLPFAEEARRRTRLHDRIKSCRPRRSRR
ncbi:MAG: hypothetical protein WA746_30035, partial [Isosphaeraceae bacterium]